MPDTSARAQAESHISVAEFRLRTLQSAGNDDIVSPPQYGDFWAVTSILVGLYMEGLLERRGNGPMWKRGGHWFITHAGRAAAAIGANRE